MDLDGKDFMEDLMREAGLSSDEAKLYLKILREGKLDIGRKSPTVEKLLSKGMVIVSGNDREFIPVHPRLAIANQYRTWREALVREIGERRMRVDKLILGLIPLYEAATEKRTGGGGG